MKDYLVGWVFTQDAKGDWRATTRDNYFELFNGGKNVVISKSDKILKALINKYQGSLEDILKIN